MGVNRSCDDCKCAPGELVMIARKPQHSFQGEAYFANDRQMARFVCQCSRR